MDINKFVSGAVMVAAGACVASVLVTVVVLAVPDARTSLGLALSSRQGYALGARVDVPASIYKESPRTVILFADRNCGVCQKVKPWLASLVAKLQCQPQVHVVMVTRTAGLSDEVDYAGDLGLAREAVVPVDVTALRVRLWPTLVVVDDRGVVQYLHEGVPVAEADRQLVFEAMTSAAQSPDHPR